MNKYYRNVTSYTEEIMDLVKLASNLLSFVFISHELASCNHNDDDDGSDDNDYDDGGDDNDYDDGGDDNDDDDGGDDNIFFRDFILIIYSLFN